MHKLGKYTQKDFLLKNTIIAIWLLLTQNPNQHAFASPCLISSPHFIVSPHAVLHPILHHLALSPTIFTCYKLIATMPRDYPLPPDCTLRVYALIEAHHLEAAPLAYQCIRWTDDLSLQDISAITSGYTLINMYLFQFDYKKGQKTGFHIK